MYVTFVIVGVLCPWMHMVYALAGNMILINKSFGKGPGIFQPIWLWTKWPAFANLFVTPLWDATYGEMHWFSALFYLLNFWVWWTLKDAGDDDWSKRLKKRLDEQVEQVRGKLVVVPVRA